MTPLITAIISFCAIVAFAIWHARHTYKKKRKNYLASLKIGDQVIISVKSGIKKGNLIAVGTYQGQKVYVVKTCSKYVNHVTEGQIITH